jgi:Txe/YoeB family toxin of Txe-Axe toxin-antitoxin module
MKVTFIEDALTEYISWQSEDKKTLSRINELIRSIQRDGFMNYRYDYDKRKYPNADY